MNANRRNGACERARFLPVGLEQRVERLIEIMTVALERPAQDPFLHGAELLKRAVAAAVQDRRARFQTMHAERLEHELEHELRALDRKSVV